MIDGSADADQLAERRMMPVPNGLLVTLGQGAAIEDLLTARADAAEREWELAHVASAPPDGYEPVEAVVGAAGRLALRRCRGQRRRRRPVGRQRGRRRRRGLHRDGSDRGRGGRGRERAGRGRLGHRDGRGRRGRRERRDLRRGRAELRAGSGRSGTRHRVRARLGRRGGDRHQLRVRRCGRPHRDRGGLGGPVVDLSPRRRDLHASHHERAPLRGRGRSRGPEPEQLAAGDHDLPAARGHARGGPPGGQAPGRSGGARELERLAALRRVPEPRRGGRAGLRRRLRPDGADHADAGGRERDPAGVQRTRCRRDEQRAAARSGRSRHRPRSSRRRRSRSSRKVG